MCGTVASESDIFKMKVLAQVEERIWSDADLPITRRDASAVGRFVLNEIITSGGARLIGKLCFVEFALFFFLKNRAQFEARKSIGDAAPVLGLLVRLVRLVAL